MGMTADVAGVPGVANGQQGIKFIAPYSVSFSNVTINLTTGVNGATLGISFYDAAGTTKLAHADGIAVAIANQGALRTAMSGTMSLVAGTAYWLQWTCSSGSVQVDAVLLSAIICQIMNKNVVIVGNSNNTTASGVTGNTIGTMSAAQTRVPTMYFD